MNKGIYILFFIIVAVSCKKDRTCECTNSNGTYDAGVHEHATKSQAKKSCESLSQGDTDCHLK